MENTKSLREVLEESADWNSMAYLIPPQIFDVMTMSSIEFDEKYKNYVPPKFKLTFKQKIKRFLYSIRWKIFPYHILSQEEYEQLSWDF